MVLKITSVDIANFRSIEQMEITFKDNCRILVGINEAGKSNILKALSLLSPNIKVDNYDIRQFGEDDDYDESAFVEFSITFPEKVANEFYLNFKNKILTNDAKLVIAKATTTVVNLENIIDKLNKGVYHIDLKTKEKGARYYSIWKFLTINKQLKKLTAQCPANFEIKTKNNKTVIANNYKIIDINSISTDIPAEYIEDVSIDFINSLYSTDVINYINENLPNVIYWKYDDKNLLPSKINKTTFITNPDACIPLKNMFELAGFSNIQEEVLNAEKRPRGLKNLLSKVAKNSTKHFKDVWKEYQNVEFELILNGDNIEPSIKEQNSFEMEQRSDGFKRFVTFLLMVSINVKTKKISDSLIIVDEPEISLHPSGARFLKDELLKIAKSNYVVYSTHSTFMIDKDNIERHYRVKKTDEKTQIFETTQSDYFDEEVLLNALGTSVFEGLKNKNLLFEGWRDKKLYNVASSKFPSEYKELKSTLQQIGTAHSKGVKGFKNLVPLIELANKECFIVSDSDAPAKDSQKDFVKQGYYGTWKRYDEIFDEEIIITSEDFIENTAFEKPLKSIAKKYNVSEFDIEQFDKNKKCKISILTDWLTKNNISNVKDVLDEIKELIFPSLKPSQIKNSYYKFLEKLALQI